MLAVVMSALAVTAPTTAAAATEAGLMHQYASVALSPDGRTIASVETARRAHETTEQHGAVVIRASDGKILVSLDACGSCKYKIGRAHV